MSTVGKPVALVRLHRVLIGSATLLAVGFGAFQINRSLQGVDGALGWAVGAGIAAIGFGAYFVWFSKKQR